MEQRGPEAPHVIVVDDDAVARLLAEGCLDARGMDVVACDSATAAWAAIGERVPDVVVSDVMMPGVSGLDLCVRLRSDPRTRDVPLLLLTASGDRQARVRALELGADDLVAKPFHADELAAKVWSLYRLARMRAISGGDRRFDATVGTITEGVVVVDASATIVRANTAAVDLLGLGDDPAGTDLDRVLAGKGASADTPGLAPGTSVRTLAVHGHDLVVRVTVTELDDAGGDGHRVVTISDVTDEQRGQDLGDLVLSLVTHKLLTPLTGIRGATELLVRSDGPASSDLVELLQRSTRRLQTTVERIIDVASAAIQDGALSLSPDSDLVALLGPAPLSESQESVLGRAQLDLVDDLQISRTALVTALRELVDNALAVAQPDDVLVRLWQERGEVVLEVADRGPGLPPGTTDKIFVPFFQGDRTGQDDGMGLGLPMVRAAVATAGGSVAVSSPSSSGAVFVVRLPAVPVHTGQHARAAMA